MYTTLLSIHSLLRWLVLYGVFASFLLASQGLLFKRSYGKVDEVLRRIVTHSGQLQIAVGLLLYFISPIIRYFFGNPANAMGNSDIRYFALEHPLIMILGVCCFVIGTVRARRKELDRSKFKTMVVWYLLAFVIFSIALPWPDSTLFPNRPLFRSF